MKPPEEAPHHVREGGNGPASVEVRDRVWMFYPRKTDRTGLVPVVVVVIVVVREVMAALCCSAAKAVKR